VKLPLPPSVNDYYGVVPGKQKRYIKREGLTYRDSVGWLMKAQPKFGTDNIAIDIVWHFRTRAGDIDNRTKPLLDALQKAGVFDNDRQVRKLNLKIGHPVLHGEVELTIRRV